MDKVESPPLPPLRTMTKYAPGYSRSVLTVLSKNA